MIKRVLAIVLLYAALPLALNAQRTIHYNYDNAGNRSSRISMRATLIENPGVTVASAAAEENHVLRSGTDFRANQLYDYDFADVFSDTVMPVKVPVLSRPCQPYSFLSYDLALIDRRAGTYSRFLYYFENQEDRL